MFMMMMQQDPRLGDVFSAMTGLDMQMFGGAGGAAGGPGAGGPAGGPGAQFAAEAEAEMAAERAAAEAAEKKRKEEDSPMYSLGNFYLTLPNRLSQNLPAKQTAWSQMSWMMF